MINTSDGSISNDQTDINPEYHPDCMRRRLAVLMVRDGDPIPKIQETMPSKAAVEPGLWAKKSKCYHSTSSPETWSGLIHERETFTASSENDAERGQAKSGTRDRAKRRCQHKKEQKGPQKPSDAVIEFGIS